MNEDEKRELERKKRIQAREARRRQQVMKQRMILAGAAVLILLVIIVSAAVNSHRKKVKQEEEIKAAQQKKAEEEAKKAESDSELHFLAVGDNILQDARLRRGKKVRRPGIMISCMSRWQVISRQLTWQPSIRRHLWSTTTRMYREAGSWEHPLRQATRWQRPDLTL